MSHSTAPLLALESSRVNARMLRRASERAAAYERWKVGDDYQNVEIRATKLDARDLKFRTAHTMRNSIKAMLRALLWTLGFTVASIVALAGPLGGASLPLLAVVALVAIALFMFTSRQVREFHRLAFVDLPLDSFLGDIAKALLASMREAELVDPDLSVENVRVTEDAAAFYDVWIDYA